MLLPRVLALLNLGLSVSAFAFEINHQSPLLVTKDDPDFPVPGDNPLEFCASPADYLLEIDNVDLSPNPPAA